MTTKSRVLFLQQYLYENTDDNHSISTNDLIAVLEANGFKANRKTVKDDVEMLINADHDILIEKDGNLDICIFLLLIARFLEWQSMLEEHLGEAAFNSDLASELVERITISRKGSIEVQYSCSDAFAEVAAMLDEGEET